MPEDTVAVGSGRVSIRWSREARGDLDRLIDFMFVYDAALADDVERQLVQAPRRLLEFPRRGMRLSEFEPREVRELRIGRYLLRYELAGTEILVLRFFHGREDRSPINKG